MEGLSDAKRTQDEYLISSTRTIDQMRKDEEFTDVVMQCANKSFNVHAIVLAANSAYFREVISSSKSHAAKRHIQLDISNHVVMEILLEFMYTGHLNLPEESERHLRQLMILAQNFRLTDFNKYLAMAARDTISPDRFARFWQLASEFGNNDLETEVLSYVIKNFASLYNTKQFQELPLRYVRRVYPRLQSAGHSADILLSSILFWAKMPTKETERVKKIPTLIRFIKLNQLSPDFCGHLIINEPIMPHIDRLWRHLNHVLNRQDLRLSEFSGSPKTDHNSLPSDISDGNRLKYTALSPVSLIKDAGDNVQGEREGRVSTLEKENGDTCSEANSIFVAEWLKSISNASSLMPDVNKHLHEDTARIVSAGKLKKGTVGLPYCQRLFGRIIVVLGSIPQKGFFFHFFSLQQYAWITLEDAADILHRGESDILHGAVTVTLNNMFYIIGGTDAITNESTNSITVYDFHQNKFWKDSRTMEKARSMAGAAVIGNAIYVVGGLQIKQNQKAVPLKSVECYVNSTEGWQHVASMPIALWLLAVASSEGTLYCFGGFDDMGYSNRCLAYNHRTNEWTIVAQMPETFSTSLCLGTGIQNKIFAFRCRNKTYNGSVYLYDRRRDVWFVLKTSGIPPKEAVFVLPWKTRIFVLDKSGKIYPFNIMTSQWEQESAPFIEPMIPMYASVLQRV